MSSAVLMSLCVYSDYISCLVMSVVLANTGLSGCSYLIQNCGNKVKKK